MQASRPASQASNTGSCRSSRTSRTHLQPCHPSNCRVIAGHSKRPAVARASSPKVEVATVQDEVELSVEGTPADGTQSWNGIPIPKVDVEDTILLQGFGWSSCKAGGWYNIVKEKVPNLQALGITHIWLPPPSQSVSKEGYLPTELYQLDTPYGSRQQLVELNETLVRAGILPVADIVINHRSAGAQSSDGKWNIFTDSVEHPGERIDWGPWAITGGDHEYGGQGSHDTGDDYGPAPDLDHTNEAVQRGLADWLAWLHAEVGFQGWRFDYVKGYGADFVRRYIERTLGGGVFHVGEYWTDLNWQDGNLEYDQGHPQDTLRRWVEEAGSSCFAFDFPTKGILQEAVKNCQYDRLSVGGRAQGLLGSMPSRAVTFVDNHDTGSTQMHWPFPSDHVPLGYAYLFTHPGVPSVLWEHAFDWGLEGHVADLVALRRRNGIRADSKLEILAAEHDMYVGRINDRVTIKLGPRYDMGPHLPNKEEGWRKAMSGKDWAIWEKVQ